MLSDTPRRVRVWRHSVGPQVEVLARRIAVERADAELLEAASVVTAAQFELNRMRTNRRTGRCRKREGGRVAAMRLPSLSRQFNKMSGASRFWWVWRVSSLGWTAMKGEHSLAAQIRDPKV